MELSTWTSFLRWFAAVAAILSALAALGAWRIEVRARREKDKKIDELATVKDRLLAEDKALGERVQRYEGDLKEKDVKLAQLHRRSNTIQTVELRVSIDFETPPAAISEAKTDVGLQSVVALFTKDRKRYRFVTDLH